MLTAKDIIPKLYATGTGDIDVTLEKGENRPFVLSSIEVHFVGRTGTADFVISRDCYKGSHFDTTLFTLTAAGTDGSDVTFYVDEQEALCRYIFDAGTDSDGQFTDVDKLKLAWTNPDSGNMRWSMIVGLAYAVPIA